MSRTWTTRDVHFLRYEYNLNGQFDVSLDLEIQS